MTAKKSDIPKVKIKKEPRFVVMPTLPWPPDMDDMELSREGIRYWSMFEYRWSSHFTFVFDEGDRLARIRMSRLKPKEWVERALLIGDYAVRCNCACLMWWDFFGGRKVANRWPHFDEYLNAPVEKVSFEDTVQGLMKFGLTRQLAARRARGTEL